MHDVNKCIDYIKLPVSLHTRTWHSDLTSDMKAIGPAFLYAHSQSPYRWNVFYLYYFVCIVMSFTIVF